jgi:phenylpropionate dioxygenase-like ring-hydroxylating dioxygenase large terminal subunit
MKETMMRPTIPPSCYTDPTIFEREKTRIFGDLWHFAGFAGDLANDNDYITTEIGTESIVVQNFKGTLRAFRNVCSHRMSLIRSEPSGNGPLRCPYHLWTYDECGIPAIPRPQGFCGLTQEQRKELALLSWQLETCGQFIFVRCDASGPSLKSYLGPMYESLADYSSGIGTRIDRYELTVEANWKVVVENTLESYHIWSVHEQTFAPQGVADEAFFIDPPHSRCTNRGMRVDTSSRSRRMDAFFASRPLKYDRYHHLFAFPTFTCSTPSGIWFGVHSIHPLSVSRTRVVIHLFVAKLEGNREQILIEYGLDAVAHFVRTVWEEDKPACERVQQGLTLVHDNEQRGTFSQEEIRVDAFQHAYCKEMSLLVADETAMGNAYL